MDLKHGIYMSTQTEAPPEPIPAVSGIPFVIGAAPIHLATAPAKVGVPVLCKNWADVEAKLGYCENWNDFGLCEFAYSHFKIFKRSPVVFCNLLDPATMKTEVEAADITVTEHTIPLPIGAIASTVAVKAEGGAGDAYVAGTDYTVFHDKDQGAIIISLLEKGSAYTATKVNVTYSKVDTSKVTAASVASGIEHMELCMAVTGTVPDLINAPGFSHDPTVAAAMALKGSAINGAFKATALVDLEAATAEAAITAKAGIADPAVIACWPKVQKDGKLYHLSTFLAGVLASVDAENNGTPYQSPSSTVIPCDAMVLSDGTEVHQSIVVGNTLNANGIVTVNCSTNFTIWGNYTTAYPSNGSAPELCFIPIVRMASYIGNTLVRNFWNKLDAPINRRLIDSIIDETNIWLNTLVGSGYLYGARVEASAEDNPTAALMQGVVKAKIYFASPAPAQEISFIIEYDPAYAASALT